MFKSANLRQQAESPAPLHLGNVRLNGPQKCPEATELILHDLVEKRESTLTKKKKFQKSRIRDCFLFICG